MESKNTKKSLKQMTKHELTAEVKRLQESLKQQAQPKESNSLQQEVEQLVKEKELWSKERVKMEEEMSKSEAFHKEYEKKMGKRTKQLETQLKKKEADLNALQEKIEKQALEENGAVNSLHKSSFRVEIYAKREGEVHGKVEHLTSRDKIPFEGLDAEKIMDFMRKHSGHLLNSIEAKDPKVKEKTSQEESVVSETWEQDASRFSITSYTLGNPGKKANSRHLNRKEAAWLNISLDTPVAEQNWDAYEWEADLFARSLSGHQEEVLLRKVVHGKVEGRELLLDFGTQTLLPGPYWINANITLSKTTETSTEIPSQLDIKELVYLY